MPSFSGPRSSSNGSVGCQSYRCGYNTTSHTAATTILAHVSPRTGSDPLVTVVALCNRHAGSIRSQISRGSRYINSQTYRFIPGNPNTMRVENIQQLARMQYVAEREAVRIARVNRLAAQRPRERAAYTGPAATLPTYGFGITAANDYGLSHVNVPNMPRITPNTARAMAARLLELADLAEERSSANG